ncbi:MAG TPA: hypothetical protein VMU68_04495 [Acidimicrobiales bacterium]|nr:hypothetical protein [Acidimicrobiales bacterium]
MGPDERLSIESMRTRFEELLSTDLLNPEDTTVLVYDHAEIVRRCTLLTSAFPDTSVHSVAVKAVALPQLLSETRAHGFGAEAASEAEIAIAIKAGIPAAQIVFDSPAKTVTELRNALVTGVGINIDNLEEARRVRELIKESPSRNLMGLRINPQIGQGKIGTTSVAGRFSKFGIPIQESRAQIIDCYRANVWLSSIHVHTGSQGMSLEQLVEGVRRVCDLALEVGDQITTVDIGGGLPVSYKRGNAPRPTMVEYVSELEKVCPELFSGRYRIVTEFGRWLFANAGWLATKIEYTKRSAERRIAVVHAGGDLFVRPIYQPEIWQHEVDVFSMDAERDMESDRSPWSVAGPLCFSGDFLAQERLLPNSEPGDWIIVQDAGAYTFSAVSRYNSRPMPKVVMDEFSQWRLLRERESADDVVNFWIGRTSSPDHS